MNERISFTACTANAYVSFYAAENQKITIRVKETKYQSKPHQNYAMILVSPLRDKSLINEDNMKKQSAGVSIAHKKDNSIYYTASVTHKGKHVSLGSFATDLEAHRCYLAARDVLESPDRHYIDEALHSTSYQSGILPFDKWVCLVNFRDNNIYIKTPIYLFKKYFLYFLEPDTVLKFGADDLFYYSNHRILRRKGYLFVNDYGSQTSILSRYGVKPYAREGIDYYFANKDPYDFSYGNLRLTNPYNGVEEITVNGRTVYRTRIHINGNYIVGRYPTLKEAAIAYNKAIDTLKSKGINRNYTANYLEDVSSIEYASIYSRIRISKRIRNL